MEEGSMRCDANVSVRKKGSAAYGRKVEVKNMNSIRNVQRAIVVEANRQMEILDSGGEVISETRLFNADESVTYPMRTKEELNDYRYFPDPDLSPVVVSEEWLASIQASQPALPWERFTELQQVYGLPAYDAQLLTESRDLADYFVEVCKHTSHYKSVSNWLMGPVKQLLNDRSDSITSLGIDAERLASLVELVEGGTVSFSSASKTLLPELIHATKNPAELAEALQLIQESNPDVIEPIVDEILREFPVKVEEFRRGKKGIIAMFMGEVMKRSKGKADPRKANELLTMKLKKV
jgi:aspartyl-tRNA(Asn)/glutamyl-tRNA(Gln) amidotransferase subunit B